MNTVVMTAMFMIGLLSFFSAERYFVGSSSAIGLRAVAGLLMLGAIAIHIWRWRQFQKTEKKNAARCEVLPTAWKIVVGLALVAWAGWQHAIKDSIDSSDTGRILLGLWVVPLVTALVAGIGIELAAYQASKDADPTRISRAGQSWTATGLLLCALVALNYAAVRRDFSRDWSYLKVTEPSEATVNIAKASSEPVTIAIFYPHDNEVLPWVEGYASRLVQLSDNRITLKITDKDLDPLDAAHFKTSRNGVVVAEVGSRQERIDLGPTLTAARPLLKKLDSEFQRLLLTLTSKPKNAYVMRGHGELNPNTSASMSPLDSSKLLEGFLRDQNWNIKTFGITEGSATRVPEDATTVILLGGKTPLLAGEVESLKEFTNRGGSLLIGLDPGKSQETLTGWLTTIGIDFDKHPVGNERNHVAATRSPVDNWFLFTTSFTGHESIKTLSHNEDKVAVLAFESGSLSISVDAPEAAKWHVTETVRSLADSFVDLNRNYKFDERLERRGATALALAAVSSSASTPDGKPSKIVVFGDSAAFSDGLIRNPGNLAYISDSMKWLAGEQALGGKLANEEDVRIRQSDNQDLIWFYGSVVFVPAMVLLAGGATIRAGKKRRPRDDQSRETGKDTEV